MNITIAGAGEVGCHLAKMLAGENHNLTIIDSDPDRLTAISDEADVVTILGNPTSIDTLERAGAKTADLFVSVFPDSDQYVNIVSALLAKQMGAAKVTARINNAEYLSHENKLLFTDLGIDLLFYPEKIAATEILELIKQAETSEFAEFAHGKLQLIVFRLEEYAPLIDKTILEYVTDKDYPPFRIVAVSRGDQTIIPNGETRFRLHDQVFVVTKKENIDLARGIAGKVDFRIRRLAILGGGRISEMVAEKAENFTDEVMIIESDKARCKELSAKLNKTLVIHNSTRTGNFFSDENIQDYDAFLALTPNSEANILACASAKRLGVMKTIAEVENLEYIRLAEEMGVDAVVNKKLITAGRIFRFTLSNKVRTIKCLSGSNAEILEYLANPGSPITKKPLKDVNFPEGAIIGGVIRGSESMIAVGSTQINAYDRVAVFALPSALKDVDKFFL
ncbi:MAG: Trk system potassium transporter TrkA [Bacteroidales bacterium]|nr:Trk system potassium transporter TrkA [Bacteroidales bacterium]MBR3526258.1 Trk system potassium transporter TrkA [Bacteroidales bacterium]